MAGQGSKTTVRISVWMQIRQENHVVPFLVQTQQQQQNSLNIYFMLFLSEVNFYGWPGDHGQLPLGNLQKRKMSEIWESKISQGD